VFADCAGPCLCRSAGGRCANRGAGWRPFFRDGSAASSASHSPLAISGAPPMSDLCRAGPVLRAWCGWRDWRNHAIWRHRRHADFAGIAAGERGGLRHGNSGPEVAAGSLARVALFGISVYIFFYAAHGPGNRDDARTRGGRALFLPVLRRDGLRSICLLVDFYFQFPAPAGFGAAVLSGWTQACSAGRRAYSTRPAHWGTSARSFW